MKSLKNIFVGFTAWLLIFDGAPAAAALRDKTLDYECRPRWDRFIIDENATNWDRNSIACYDKFGNEIDPVKLYGAPKLYGEYEGSAEIAAMYGNPADASRAARLYGKYDPNLPGVKPVRARAPLFVPAPKKAALQEPAGPKNKAKPKPAKAPPPVRPPDPKPVKAAPAAARMLPVPDEKARRIAGSLGEKIITEESYCTRINPPVMGPLPKGLVLMAGRPDRMSCVKN
jgi:hypothetical protein